MTPILGIMASQISGHLASPTSFDSIQTVTVGSGGSSSVSFTSIPSTYKHLQIRWIGRSTRSLFVDGSIIRFNGDSGSNYSKHNLYGTNLGSVGSESGVSQTGINLGDTIGATATAGIFTPGVIDILDYQNTSKYKTLRALQGYYFDSNTGVSAFKSGLWMSSSAISSITITPEVANYAQYSSFALYGIKG
jgi:hypothetical protein